MASVTVHALGGQVRRVGDAQPDLLRGRSWRVGCEHRWVVGEELEPRGCGRVVWVDPGWRGWVGPLEITCPACAGE